MLVGLLKLAMLKKVVELLVRTRTERLCAKRKVAEELGQLKDY
jgi:hypothetical protein